MIKFVEGDFFDYDADVRVNTVNCVGVMGAGVALAFKKKFPEMYKDYKSACSKKEIKPGKPHVWSKGDMFSKRLTIINFPTKDHWRRPSTYEYVESGLIWLRNFLSTYSDDSCITIPALGCGHGGLDWEIVKKLIIKHLSDLEIKVLVFEPVASQNAANTDEFNFDKANRFLLNGIKELKCDGEDYPDLIKQWSDRKLLVKGKVDVNSEFDIALIISSKPDENEQKIVHHITNKIIKFNKSVFLGPSKFEQKLLKNLSSEAVKVGVSLPSGIVKRSEDDTFIKGLDFNNVSLFSVGDPFIDFDRKSFIPSTLLRVYMAKNVIITTPAIDWIFKYKKQFFRNNNKVFYVERDEIEKDYFLRLSDLGAKPLSDDFFS